MPIEFYQVEAAENACRFAALAAEAVLHGNPSPFDLRTALQGTLLAVVTAGNALNGIRVDLEVKHGGNGPVPARVARPEKQSGDHRHKFGPDGRCTVPGCERVKGAAGRKPAVELAPPADARTASLPFEAGAADRFAGGGMGSSGRQVGR